jgi:ferredoxin-NADP reductase
MHVTLDHVETHTDNIRTFWCRPERKLRYTAGEFIEVHLPHDNTDNRGDKRWFSLYSAPSEELIAFTNKFPQDRSSSFKQALSQLQPGDQLSVSDPMGEFLLPKDTHLPIVFVARSIGITPVRSIIKWLSDTNEQRNIHLLYSVSDPSELIAAPLFDSYLGNRWQSRTDRLSGADMLALTDHNPETVYYLAGPETMASSLAAELRATGVSDYKVITDYFPGYPS